MCLLSVLLSTQQSLFISLLYFFEDSAVFLFFQQWFPILVENAKSGINLALGLLIFLPVLWIVLVFICLWDSALVTYPTGVLHSIPLMASGVCMIHG